MDVARANLVGYRRPPSQEVGHQPRCQRDHANLSCVESPRNIRLEKRQRPDLNALARARVRRRGRIVKCGVCGPAGAAVLL